MGLLASLDRPGGNVTGVIFFGVTLGGFGRYWPSAQSAEAIENKGPEWIV
jgi:hypothetical protein